VAGFVEDEVIFWELGWINSGWSIIRSRGRLTRFIFRTLRWACIL